MKPVKISDTTHIKLKQAAVYEPESMGEIADRAILKEAQRLIKKQEAKK